MKTFVCLVLLSLSLVVHCRIISPYQDFFPPGYKPPGYDVLITDELEQQNYTWTLIGSNVGATSDDCPYLLHGTGTTLEDCESGCIQSPLCNVINFNPTSKDCVYRACSDPLHPKLTPSSGYSVYAIPKKAAPLPTNSSIVKLVSSSTPFIKGENISFFGDSITWLGYYIQNLNNAIESSEYTKDLGITLVNRGINGGTVKDVRDGGKVLTATYPSFKEAIAMDKPKVIAIQIGINDVWFPTSNHSSPLPVFKQILQDLVITAKSLNIKVYLGTVSVIGEKRDGQDPHDVTLDAFAQGQIEVANAVGVPLVNLRKAYLDYDALYNTDDVYNGILTYDGVHPTGYGAALLANHHAEGLVAVGKP
jgi:lysophospholipase L1-like esterase